MWIEAPYAWGAVVAAGYRLAERYQLDRNLDLGHGAMGEVWSATDLYLDCLVAVKPILTDLLNEAAEDATARFRREGRAAARLNHPNIAVISRRWIEGRPESMPDDSVTLSYRHRFGRTSGTRQSQASFIAGICGSALQVPETRWSPGRSATSPLDKKAGIFIFRLLRLGNHNRSGVVGVRLGRTAVALCVVTALVVGVALALAYEDRRFVGTAIAVGPLAWAALAGTTAWWVRGRDIPAGETTAAQADAAADWLALEVAGRWRQEAAARRIVTPAPASVRWRWAGEDLSVPPGDAAAEPPAGTGPVPLPGGFGRPGVLLTSGVVTRLHDEVYARLPRGRLVLTGGPGSGKTGAMVLLLLAALERRAALDGDARLRVPVPVWLTMGGWDPQAVSLAEWVTGVLNRDYPALRAARYGGDAAGALLRSGRVALFLDGLDEVPAELRAGVFQRLNDEAGNVRVVLTSRPQEYRLALAAAGLDQAAVLELRPVRPDAAAAYLLRGTAGPARERWQRLADYLKASPGSVLAAALDNPLALSLARDAYASADPGVLLDPGRFPTAEAVTGQLIDQFLVTAYPGRRQRAHAVRWLSWIAARMGTSQDLRWWDIPGWVPWSRLRLARALLAGLPAWLIVTLTAWLIYRLTFVDSYGQPLGIVSWAEPGYATGTAVAILAGLAFPLSPAPVPPPKSATAAPSPPAGKPGLPSPRQMIRRAGGWWRTAPRWQLLVPAGLCAVLAAVLEVRSGDLAAVVFLPAVIWAGGWLLVAFRDLQAHRFPFATVGRLAATGTAFGVALGLWTASLGGQVAAASVVYGAVSGVLVFGTLGFAFQATGFGRIGAPRLLTPRWPRPVWLFPVWLLLWPLLLPHWLNRWAAPAADAPAATAAGTYRADRRTSAIRASAYAALPVVPVLAVVLVLVVRNPGIWDVVAVVLGWTSAFGMVTWLTTWLGAGQVPLVQLAQLALRADHGRVSFNRLLRHAHDRQVLRQAGAVYQFRHAALQTRLADAHASTPIPGMRQQSQTPLSVR